MSKFEEIKDKVSDKLNDLGSHDYSKDDSGTMTEVREEFTRSPRDPNDYADDSDDLADEVTVEEESFRV